MHELKGRNLPLTGPRRFVIDLVHFARQIPSTPVSRPMDVSALTVPRDTHPARPSWAVLFMKAYALVGADHPPLRRALLEFPWPRLYEHPWMNCAWRSSGRSRRSRGSSSASSGHRSSRRSASSRRRWPFYKSQPVEDVGVYRRAMCVSRGPALVRRLLWWSTLHISGYKRAKRFGTFGLTSYGALGAESLHPISPLTTTMTYGPISPAGEVIVKLIYDHRVLDGAYIARRLRDIEDTLHGPILDELRRDRSDAPEGLRTDSAPGLVGKPHFLNPAPGVENPPR